MDITRLTFALDLICCIGISLSYIQDIRMDCISGCTGVDDGDYQSCDGCNVYVTCSNERIYDSRLCPGNLVWDDNKKRCQDTSNTCVRTGDIGKCVFDCTNRADGDYQSCLGCGVYVTCSNGVRHDNRPCPSNLVWDDNVKQCQYISTTCRKVTCGINKDIYFGQCLCSPGFKKEYGKCVLECDKGLAGDTFIRYPRSEVRCTVNGSFFRETAEDCRDFCGWYDLCRSAVYYDSTGTCLHSPCEPFRILVFDGTPTFNKNIEGATLFVKNCRNP